jgi:uncharacterized lipoprotein YmbA
MVTRVDENEIMFSEIYRWGEPLDANFARVLADNLSRHLGTDRIVAFPWFDATRLDYALRVSVFRFEADEHGVARLLARWLVAEPISDKVLHSGESDLRHESAGDSPDAAVTALSATVAQLSREIAESIERLRR